MDKQELRQAIITTLREIHKIEEQLAQATDPQEKRRLRKRLKELRYLQLWNLEKYERSEK